MTANIYLMLVMVVTTVLLIDMSVNIALMAVNMILILVMAVKYVQ